MDQQPSQGQAEQTPKRQWRSPLTGAQYPVGMTLRAPDPAGGPPLVMTLEPLLDAQEHAGTLSRIPYWEGACLVRDPAGKTIGQAYLELTGYAATLGGRF